MEKDRKYHWSHFIPIGLMAMYISLFFCINLQSYADNYIIYVTFVDTFLFVESVLFYFVFGNRWSVLAKKSLITVTSLNLLTELDMFLERKGYERVEEYYILYCIILSIYLISLLPIVHKYYKT